jgi:antitoxin component YwqK of YwqJK toxin-antitoxin module
MKINYILFLFFLFMSCNKKHISYWENGKIRSIESASKDKMHLDGKCIYYYENGKKFAVQFVRMDTLYGKIKEWDSIGNLICIKQVILVDRIEEKLSDSMALYYLLPFLKVNCYHKNGRLKSIGYERYGRKQGNWRYFDENENLIDSVKYEND